MVKTRFRFRTIDGTCHNRLNSDRGREKRAFKRMLPAAYDDGEGKTSINNIDKLRRPFNEEVVKNTEHQLCCQVNTRLILSEQALEN